VIGKNLKLLVKSIIRGHKKIERPISLLIVLWLVALLVIGAITNNRETEDELECVEVLSIKSYNK
jgi:hypothetical protein